MCYLLYNINFLNQIFVTLVVKDGVSEKKAKFQVNELCGQKWTQSFEKAKNNTLDALVSLENEKSKQRLENLCNILKIVSGMLLKIHYLY